MQIVRDLQVLAGEFVGTDLVGDPIHRVTDLVRAAPPLSPVENLILKGLVSEAESHITNQPVKTSTRRVGAAVGTNQAPRALDEGEQLDGRYSYAAARWAHAMALVINSRKDPRTFADWGRLAAASPGTLRNRCRMARLPPRRSLLLARLLRAVVQQQLFKCRAEDLLDVSDKRTLVKLFHRGGSETRSSLDFPRDAHALLHKQRLIVDSVALRALEAALNVSVRKAPIAVP